MLALETLDPTVAGICFLIATVLFVIAAVVARPMNWASLVAVGLAFCAFVFAYNWFAAG